MPSTRPPIFGVTGWKNSGKTTLVVRLVEELTGRGYRVSTVKHAHHDFDIDREGTDSHRHRLAGATEVALVSGRRWALMHELREAEEPAMDEIVARIAPCDLILIEGYKREDHPKIEARRTETLKKEPLAPKDPNILAIAADYSIEEADRPVFDLDNVGEIADFIVTHTGLDRSNAAE